MHKSSMLRMEWFIREYASKIKKKNVKVLDVGSYDVNGSYSVLFDKYEYVGLDIVKGKNVDIVIPSPYDWSSIKSDHYDIVISGQAFEHIEFFWITIEQMARVLKRNGLMCIIVPNGAGEHRYPVDCYRFFTDGMIALARYVNLEVLHAHTNCSPNKQKDWVSRNNADSMLVATKKYDGSPVLINKNYGCIPANQEELRIGFTPYKSRTPSIRRILRKMLLLKR